MIIGIRNEQSKDKRASMQRAIDVLLTNYGVEHATCFEIGVVDGYAWKCKSGEWGTITFLHSKGKTHMNVKKEVVVKKAKYSKKGKLKAKEVTKKVKEKVWAIRVTSNNEKRVRL